ncbi:aminodeoxychorismate lyase [Providencia burhodogranariea]|uniref:Aminodeoxychorismate lyase n=1 Tax=Providencia burhodogranariea DSM 19968 TaxID=1141662 RepID=K8X2U4_9GAMM|nr:aminodeoxychorismate lyase [Providencia burhodogranariea]EKT63972.1 4-amino-4-deoxychorismate lyase [Providencia burhodogranariea DSM 19968]
MSYWVNGVVCNSIDVSDRAVQFGDGCFTTIHVFNHQPKMMDSHIARLVQDSARLKLPQPDWQALEAQVHAICQQQIEDEFVCKVIISRGTGGRGYSSVGFNQPTVIISVASFPQHYQALQQLGVKLILSRIPISKNPYLAGMKHLNRLEQILIRQEIDEADFDEALVVDTDGILIECCSANIFWRKGETVFTPSLAFSGVNGLMRQKILAHLLASPYDLQEVERFPEVLGCCDEVLICNTLMPILPVASIRIDENKPLWHYLSRELFEYLFLRCQI